MGSFDHNCWSKAAGNQLGVKQAGRCCTVLNSNVMVLKPHCTPCVWTDVKLAQARPRTDMLIAGLHLLDLTHHRAMPRDSETLNSPKLPKSADWLTTFRIVLRLLVCTSSTAQLSWWFAACQWLAVEQADCVAPAPTENI